MCMRDFLKCVHVVLSFLCDVHILLCDCLMCLSHVLMCVRAILVSLINYLKYVLMYGFSYVL